MIDTELYQLISLGLGALLLLVTLLVLSTLGKINKTLEKLGSQPVQDAEPVQVAPEPASFQPAQEAPAAQEPPAAQHAPAAQETAANQYTSTTYETAAPQQQEPAAQETTAGEGWTAPETVQEAQPAVTESIPEEQPFERDGRWWFKRGLEILVYDEQTGQWKPEPNNPFTGGGASAPQAGAVTTQVPTQESGAGFWKCPSCGAVNGATSATCRMCFAARP